MLRLTCRVVALVCLLTAAAQGQTPAPIGRIAGGDFRLRGHVEFAADGGALLISGSEVEVRSGTTRLALPGGEARFCGPLKAVVLKSAPGDVQAGEAEDAPLLFALQTGTLELDSPGVAAHIVQTPFFTISLIPVLEASARRLAVHLAANGDACVSALAGSLRVREQFGPSELLVPPGKALLIPVAGVEKAAPVAPASCACGGTDILLKAGEPPAAGPPPAAPPVKKSEPETKTTIATAPLTYQADADAEHPRAAAKEPEVTLPVVVTPPPSAEPPPPAAREAAAPPAAAKPAKAGFGTRLKNFFRALFRPRPSR